MYSSKDTPFWTSDWAIAFIAWFEGIAWGQRMRPVIVESVPARFAHLPQYRDGMWSHVKV